MRWLVVAATAFAVSAVSPGVPTSPLCSKGYQATVRPDHYFLGTATGDTLLAGPGRTAPAFGGGHFGSSEPGEFYGQVIQVDRLSQHSSLRARQPSRVVVVPWDYDASCRALRWGGTAVFMPEGTTGVYDLLHLRAEEDWVEDIPTFDAFSPSLLGYPNSLRKPRPDPSQDLAPLSATELFQHLESMPAPRDIDELGWAAVEPFISRLDDDPNLRRRYPLGHTYGRFAAQRPDIEARGRGVPVAGTYRVEISWPSGREEFMIRTSSAPISAWWDPPREEVLGQTFLFWLADDASGVESAVWPQRSLMSISRDSVQLEDEWEWSGAMFLAGAPGFGSPELQSLLGRWESINRQRRANATPSTGFVFRRSRSGDVSFSGAWVVDEGLDVAVRGQRVSDVARARPYR